MQVFDAVIIGAGHNGLTAAAYLARSGESVIVLESRDIIGGACVTEEVWPGYRVSTAAYLCSLLHPRIVEDLELRRHGFHVYRRLTGGFAPFPDGSSLLIYPDAARTRESLMKSCPEDVTAYFELEEDLDCAAEVLEPFFFGPSPSLGELEIALRAAGLERLWEELFIGSVRSMLDQRFRSDRLKAVLAVDGLIGTCAGVSDPGTAYVLLHHYMGRVLGVRGLWGYVQGGMGRITEALANSCREAAGVIRVASPVAHIHLEGDAAIGVVLESGEEIRARAVLSNAHPCRTFGMVDSTLPAQIANSLSTWRTEGISCKINLAVTELPDFIAMPGVEPGPQHLGTVHLSNSMDQLERAWRDCAEGRPSSEPIIEMYIQTATDRTLAPEGRHILSCFTQYFPYTLAEGLNHAQEADAYLRRVLDAIARFAPNVPGSIESVQVLTPSDLEARFGLTGGHIFHGDITPDQMFGGRMGLRGAETPIPGLWLCGSGAFPGGCVSGIPGYNAARGVLAASD